MERLTERWFDKLELVDGQLCFHEVAMNATRKGEVRDALEYFVTLSGAIPGTLLAFVCV